MIQEKNLFPALQDTVGITGIAGFGYLFMPKLADQMSDRYSQGSETDQNNNDILYHSGCV